MVGRLLADLRGWGRHKQRSIGGAGSVKMRTSVAISLAYAIDKLLLSLVYIYISIANTDRQSQQWHTYLPLAPDSWSHTYIDRQPSQLSKPHHWGAEQLTQSQSTCTIDLVNNDLRIISPISCWYIRKDCQSKGDSQSRYWHSQLDSSGESILQSSC